MHPHTIRDIVAFDKTHRDTLLRIWFLGDVHGDFRHIGLALQRQRPEVTPRWLVFLGDLEIFDRSLGEIIAPLRAAFPSTRVAFIHGNHDADEHENWERLHDAGDAVPLHGQVVELDGVKVAGLGGNFLGRVWSPPEAPKIAGRQDATYRHPNLVKRGQRHAPSLNGAIYKDEVDALARLDADILVTHEAFSCHHHGWEALDQLARDLQVVRAFHGHTHDDRTDQYREHRERLGFEAVAVNFRCIKNGLGQMVFDYALSSSEGV